MLDPDIAQLFVSSAVDVLSDQRVSTAVTKL